jgi:hypothetical protein
VESFKSANLRNSSSEGGNVGFIEKLRFPERLTSVMKKKSILKRAIPVPFGGNTYSPYRFPPLL